MDTEQDTGTGLQIELYKSRLRLKKEMQRALACISPSSKRALVAEWQDKYSDIFYRELLNCAKNKHVAREIADWNVEGMK